MKPKIITAACLVGVASSLIGVVYATSPRMSTNAKNRSGSWTGLPEHPFVIKFDFAKADLKEEKGSMAEFATIAAELKNYPYAKLEIDGHTDAIGPKAVNQKLSEERALAIRRYFTGRYGIPPERIVVRAFADTRPAMANGTAYGRSENRRAVVRVYRLEPTAAGSDKQTL